MLSFVRRACAAAALSVLLASCGGSSSGDVDDARDRDPVTSAPAETDDEGAGGDAGSSDGYATPELPDSQLPDGPMFPPEIAQVMDEMSDLGASSDEITCVAGALAGSDVSNEDQVAALQACVSAETWGKQFMAGFEQSAPDVAGFISPTSATCIGEFVSQETELLLVFANGDAPEPATVSALAPKLADCVDLGEVITQALAADERLAAMPAEVHSCIADAVMDANGGNDGLWLLALSGEELVEPETATMMACLS